MSGLQLAEKIHAEKPDLKTIISSGYNAETNHVGKPTAGTSTLARIKQQLAHYLNVRQIIRNASGESLDLKPPPKRAFSGNASCEVERDNGSGRQRHDERAAGNGDAVEGGRFDGVWPLEAVTAVRVGSRQDPPRRFKGFGTP
jgi:hypothetical protein